MRAKKVVYFLSFLLVSSAFAYGAGAAQIINVSYHGVGVTVDLVYPEEAHPGENMSHNLTITTNTIVEIQNVTLFIYAPVDSTLQFINKSTIILPPLPANTSLPFVIRFTLPQNANGTLYCLLYVQTDQSADYSSYSFYTTQVRTLTYSELWNEYTELLANYTILQTWHDGNLTAYNNLLTQYETLLGDYDRKMIEYENLTATYNELYSKHEALNSNYSTLLVNYANLNSTFYTLLAQNNDLQSKYDSLDSRHNSLQTTYNSLLSTKNTLQSEYTSLNSTNFDLQESYDVLESSYALLNQDYTALQNEIENMINRISSSENALNVDRVVMFIFIAAVASLIALVIYLKRKEPEPYVVIRKETVAMNQEEEQ